MLLQQSKVWPQCQHQPCYSKSKTGKTKNSYLHLCFESRKLYQQYTLNHHFLIWLNVSADNMKRLARIPKELCKMLCLLLHLQKSKLHVSPHLAALSLSLPSFRALLTAQRLQGVMLKWTTCNSKEDNKSNWKPLLRRLMQCSHN